MGPKGPPGSGSTDISRPSAARRGGDSPPRSRGGRAPPSPGGGCRGTGSPRRRRCSALEEVDLGGGRVQGPDRGGVDLIVEHGEVAPPGGPEGAGAGHGRVFYPPASRSRFFVLTSGPR